MIYLARFCCICLNNRQKLEKLSTNHENNLSYYNKLSILFPHMNVNEVKEVVYVCGECTTRIDDMYDFREMCMSNNVILQTYISKLRLCNNSQFRDSIVLNKLTDDEIYKYNISHNSEYTDFNTNDTTQTNVNVNKKNNDECFHSEINISIKKESCDDDIDEYETQFDKFQYDDINIKTEDSAKYICENNASSSNQDISTFLIKKKFESIHSEIDIKQESCGENNTDEYEPHFADIFTSDHTNIKIENCIENEESTSNIDRKVNQNACSVLAPKTRSLKKRTFNFNKRSQEQKNAIHQDQLQEITTSSTFHLEPKPGPSNILHQIDNETFNIRPDRPAKTTCINRLINIITYINNTQLQESNDRKRRKRDNEAAEVHKRRLNRMRQHTYIKRQEESEDQRIRRLQNEQVRSAQRRAKETDQ